MNLHITENDWDMENHNTVEHAINLTWGIPFHNPNYQISKFQIYSQSSNTATIYSVKHSSNRTRHITYGELLGIRRWTTKLNISAKLPFKEWLSIEVNQNNQHTILDETKSTKEVLYTALILCLIIIHVI